MPGKRQNRPQKGGVRAVSAPQPPPSTPQDGPAFAESIPADSGYLGQELTIQGQRLAMADLYGLPNPDPILRAEGKSLSTYRQMVDDHLSSVMSKRLAAVQARPWTIERGKGSARDTAKLAACIGALPVRDIVESILSAVGMGYSIQEVVWGVVDGWIVPIKIKGRPPEHFRLGLRGEARFLDEMGRNEIVPPRKLLIARYRADGDNPYGRPVLSECFWPLVFKRGGMQFWMTFCDKFGLPKVVGKVPASMSGPEKLALLVDLAAMVRDAAAVIPEGTSVQLLETKVSGDLPFPALVKQSESAMSKAWLGEVLSTDTQATGGTYGAQAAANEVRADLALNDANLVESMFAQLILWIWEVNSLGGVMPTFHIHMPEDLKAGRLERDKGLHDIGVRFTAVYFQEAYDLAPEHIARIDDGSGSLATAGAGGGAAFAEPQEQDNGEAELVDLLTAMAPEELQGQMEEALRPLLNAIDQAPSFGEVEAILDRLIPDLSFDQFQAVMTKCLLLAETKGRIDADG